MTETKVEAEVQYGTIGIGPFTLESGSVIDDVVIAYERTGPRNAPVVFVCHALTGNQFAVGTDHEPGWWSGLIGPGKTIDTDEWQVITMNVLGGCNGSTGPASIDPNTGQPYRANFPFVTVRDIVCAHFQALKLLGVERLRAVIGASLGGMQVLEWGIQYPRFVERIIPMAVTPYLSDYAVAYNAMARLAIQQDPNWKDGFYSEEQPPASGIGLARMIGMVTYRTPAMFNGRFKRERFQEWGQDHRELAFDVESYLVYQGEKLSRRFDANSYLYLLKAMDSHDIGRGRGGWQQALQLCRAPLFAFSFQGDLLYPPDPLKQLADWHRNAGKEAHFFEVETKFGHDGFLVEFERWAWKLKGCLHGD
ncbi:MAG TPA: homoserine O-acetyltransferase [Bacillales bacterium]|nr:homoserine O-acetyltransferase [Bacillales bacterium]